MYLRNLSYTFFLPLFGLSTYFSLVLSINRVTYTFLTAAVDKAALAFYLRFLAEFSREVSALLAADGLGDVRIAAGGKGGLNMTF